MCQYPGAPRVLHSFPTRRSSDLDVADVLSRRGASVIRPLKERLLDESAPVELRREIPIVLLRKVDRDLAAELDRRDRKSTRLNSSHVEISYAVLCLKQNNQLSSV